MSLSRSQISHLRSLAHHLKPVVMVGNKGVTDKLLAELNVALNAHELIKVTIAADRNERQVITQILCENAQAEIVQIIGRISVLYRPAKPARLVLPPI